MKNTHVVILLMLVLPGCALDLGPPDNGDEQPPSVCLQITEYSDAPAFEQMIAALEARGAKATILVNGTFATENCDRLKGLHDDGFEVMAFVRPETAEGDKVLLSTLPFEEQQAVITDTKTAIEECLNETVVGFRPTGFDQNTDTYDILDSLGFEFNLGFVAHTTAALPGHEHDTLPYRMADYGFWAVPMHSIDLGDGRLPFCDKPLSRAIDPADLEEALKSELDTQSSKGRPLMVEIHPQYTVSNETLYDAYLNFLDYAVGQNVYFMSTAELVERFGQE